MDMKYNGIMFRELIRRENKMRENKYTFTQLVSACPVPGFENKKQTNLICNLIASLYGYRCPSPSEPTPTLLTKRLS
jgi:hypothetical protein